MAFAVDGDEGSELSVFPPGDQAQMHRWQGAVHEHGVLGFHLTHDMWGQEVFSLVVFGHGLAAAPGHANPHEWEGLIAIPGQPDCYELHPDMRCDECAAAAGLTADANTGTYRFDYER